MHMRQLCLAVSDEVLEVQSGVVLTNEGLTPEAGSLMCCAGFIANGVRRQEEGIGCRSVEWQRKNKRTRLALKSRISVGKSLASASSRTSQPRKIIVWLQRYLNAFAERSLAGESWGGNIGHLKTGMIAYLLF